MLPLRANGSRPYSASSELSNKLYSPSVYAWLSHGHMSEHIGYSTTVVINLSIHYSCSLQNESIAILALPESWLVIKIDAAQIIVSGQRMAKQVWFFIARAQYPIQLIKISKHPKIRQRNDCSKSLMASLPLIHLSSSRWITKEIMVNKRPITTCKVWIYDWQKLTHTLSVSGSFCGNWSDLLLSYCIN